jgi:glycosyltransferase involved in cell wall biosynthesis
MYPKEYSNLSAKKTKKVAFNATAYDPLYPGGVHRYTTGLINELLDDQVDINSVLYVPTSNCPDSDLYRNKNIDICSTPASLNIASTKASLSRLYYQQMSLRKSLTQKGVSLLYSPVPEGLLFPISKQIITVHDLIPLVIPESTKLLKYYYSIILPRLLKVSDAIFVDSESTKKDIEKYYPEVNKPIHVKYLGYNSDVFSMGDSSNIEKVTSKYDLQNTEYLLVVGECRAYKNTTAVIQAFSLLSSKNIKLVIVGKLNKSDKDIHSIPKDFGVQDRVKFLGYVPNEDLATLYQGATAFIFPSLYEGFGLPILEAMACGCPIAASNTSSIPEVGGSAAVYFDPHDINDMAKVISDLLASESLQSRCRALGLERVKSFSSAVLSRAVIDLCYEYA